MNEFKFCPQCGSKNIETHDSTHWTCPDCGYDLYNNDAAAVGLFLISQGKMLTFTRTKNPQKGKRGLPGGFVNKGESLEEACRRECSEEIGIVPPEFSYLCSFPNTYPYKTLVYSTCDAFFYAECSETPEEILKKIQTVDGEAENCKFINIDEFDVNEIAFDSMRKAFAILKEKLQVK